MSKPTLRTVVVPTEHGGWGFTLEPVLIGTLVAPGLPALGVALATFATFLTRRPLRMAFADWKHDRHLERTTLAARSVVALGFLALIGLILTFVTASDPFWWPLVIAAPMVLVQLRLDLANRGRELLPELLGPIALGAAAPMIILAEGFGWRIALGAWLVLVARIVPSVLLVRAQLRRAKHQKFSTAPTTMSGIAAVAGVAGVAAGGWAPWASVVAALMVSLWGFVSMDRPPVPAKTIGWTQMIVGLTVVLAFALGYHSGW